MRVPNAHEKKSHSLLIITAIIVTTLVGTAVIAAGRSSTSTINITVKNQTQRSITHLYLAPGDPNNWGPDQLNGSTIPPNGSYVLNNVACNGSSVRVIAEDQNGCFFYNNAACDANGTWEISAEATPDCGGN